jgi:transposase-like protein
MWRSEERDEVVRAVQRGEAVSAVASRLGVPVSTVRSWVRVERRASLPRPVEFMELTAELVTQATLVIRIGVATIEVRAGFDAGLLRQVAAALGGAA